MPNPFQYEKLPSPEDFCGRKLETEKLRQLTMDGKNVVLFGDRRYGKTSLIEHVFRDMPKNKLHAFADLFACTEGLDVAVAIYQAVYDALPFDIERKLKELKSVFTRINIGLEVTATGSQKITPNLLSRDFEQLISDALSGADRLCEKHGASLIIALDEFQQVAEIKDKRVDAVLRAYMQRLDHVSFIFSGSKKSILSGLFSNKSMPLYGMATSISIGGIELELLKDFCEVRLGKTFDPGVFEQLYNDVRGQTKLILQTCWGLYASGADLSLLNTRETLDGIIRDKDEEFKLLFNSYTSQQKKAIKMIGQFQGKHLFHEQKLDIYRIKKQNLNQVLTRLIAVGDVVQLEDDSYALSDVHFHLWVLKSFG